jgi:hypothetical protein
MVYFQTKNPNLGKVLRVSDWKMYFMYIWNILLKFTDHLVHLVLIWYIFPILISRTKKNLATLVRRTVRFIHAGKNIVPNFSRQTISGFLTFAFKISVNNKHVILPSTYVHMYQTVF